MEKQIALLLLCLFSGCQLDGTCSQNAGLLPLSGLAGLIAYTSCETVGVSEHDEGTLPTVAPQAPLRTKADTPDMGASENITPTDMSRPIADLSPQVFTVVRSIGSSDWTVKNAVSSSLSAPWPKETKRHESEWNPAFPPGKPYLTAELSAKIPLDSAMRGRELMVKYFMATRLQWDAQTPTDTAACPYVPKAFLVKQSCLPGWACQQTCVQALASFQVTTQPIVTWPYALAETFGNVPLGSPVNWNISPDASGHGVLLVPAYESKDTENLTFLFSTQGRVHFIPPTITITIEYKVPL